MAGMAATLTLEDIEAVAEYYSKKTPALGTLPKKKFFFSADSGPAH
jgi:cytochrome c553